MATFSRSHQVIVAVVIVVALFVCAVESSGYRRPRPAFPSTGSNRRTNSPRFRTMGASGRSRSSYPKPPPLFQERVDNLQGPPTRGSGDWLRKQILTRLNKEALTPAPTSRPIGKTVTNTTIGPLKVNIIETIDVKKCNMTNRNAHHQASNDEQEAVSNRTTPTPTSSRLAFTADEARIECGGPNEASREEECYRFILSTDLNNATISGAIVLVSKTSPGIGDSLRARSNISVVAKFPTLGEGAFRESLSAQNVSFDVPKYWGHALLPQGASLIARALRESSILVLKMTVITESNGHATANNYIPMNSKLLPVLLVDIEFNSTESSATTTTTSTTSSSTGSADTPNNVVGRLLRRRRRRHSDIASLSSTDKPSKSEEPEETEAHSGVQLGNVSCTGYPGCCQRQVTFDLEAFGWDWMIMPRQITTTLCFGSCLHLVNPNTLPEFALFNYALRGQSGHYRSTDASATTTNTSLTSCVPSQSHPLSVLMFDENLDIIFAQLPVMIVSQCSCAITQNE